MRLTSIASGSSGNCIYVGSEDGHLLVDVGISAKRIEASLKELDLTGHDIDGILITHEHIDHISGLGVLTRRYGTHVYTTPGTKRAILNTKSVGAIKEELIHEILPDKDFLIKGLTINATAVWHDAAEPVCYSVSEHDVKASIATDMGDYNNHIVDKLSDSNILFIEANHDTKMLEVGPYPYPLKQRILGKRGHLSNERAGQLINALLCEQTQNVFLGHLSKDNNFEELAYETVKLELRSRLLEPLFQNLQIQVAKRDTLSDLVTVD